MSNSTADNQESERSPSAEPRLPDEENLVQRSVRDIVNSLEKSISRYYIACAVLFPILFFLSIIVLILLQVPEPWGFIVPLFVVFSTLGIVNVLAETRLPRRAARRFALVFPEGSPERADAIAMLSKIKTPNKAGKKLLQALTPPAKPSPATPAEPTKAPSARQLLGCLAGMAIFAVVMIAGFGIDVWLSKLNIDQNVRRSVLFAVFGVGGGISQVWRTRRALTAALVWIVTNAIVWGLMGGLGTWLQENYGWWAFIALAAGLILVSMLVMISLKPFWAKEIRPR